MCQCFMIGGPFIAEDPECPAHGYEAQRLEREEEERQRLIDEAGRPGVWYKTKERAPEPGMIVKRWKNGAVWAGMFSGNAKDSSFDEWMKLPT